jgi:hypothetical protein
VQTISIGFAPSGIAASGSLAIVSDLQGASLSLINLLNFGVTRVSLPTGSRPHTVAISDQAGKAIVTTPMSNRIFVLDLASKALTSVDTGSWNAIGPDAVAILGNLAFVANQMTSTVTVLDLTQARVVSTFAVDPGPRALAINSAGNQLLVLAQGTRTIDVVDLQTLTIVSRIDAGATERQGTWLLPWISSISPASAAAGTGFTLSISGTNLHGVTNLRFEFAGPMSGGMMGGGMGPGMGRIDPNIQVNGVQVSADGTNITTPVQISTAASAGPRQIRLLTSLGEVMGPIAISAFTVTR